MPVGDEIIVKGNTVEVTPFNGLEVFDYTAGMDASASLAIINVPPDARHPEAYSTKSDKYYYVLEGQIRFGLGSKRFDLGPGDMCLVRREQHFWYENSGTTQARLLLVHTPGFDPQSEFVT